MLTAAPNMNNDNHGTHPTNIIYLMSNERVCCLAEHKDMVLATSMISSWMDSPTNQDEPLFKHPSIPV